jgi:hypothetical protein
MFLQVNFSERFRLDRRFDLVLCLEVAEHLEGAQAEILIDSLVCHSDVVLFSGAAPGQPGQHHVNCQWPEYWQHLFNTRGYVCSDRIRWTIWNDSRVEPWYRQNIFVASLNPTAAGKEPRILPVRHPESWWWDDRNHFVRLIEEGLMPPLWYLSTTLVHRQINMGHIRRCPSFERV